MHLKPYPNPQKKEPVVEGPCSLHVDQQGALRRDWAAQQSYPLMAASSGCGTANRCPLGVLSPNTLHRSSQPSANSAGFAGTWAGRKGKNGPPVPAKVTLTSSLVLLASPTGLENEVSLRIYQSEDADGPLDILAMIKPGNTQEKIAIFAGRQRGRLGGDASGVGAGDAAPTGEGGPQDARFTCRIRGCRVTGVGCSLAKRRRLGKMEKTKGTDSQSAHLGRPPPLVPLCDTRAPSAGESEGEGWPRGGEGEEGGRMVSVVERVAVLEEMANGRDQNMDFKPVQLRGSGSLARPKAPTLPPEPKMAETTGSQEEPESVRVLDMVARLESECLKSQSCRESGELSRNNSLRRNVARVLLAGSEPYQAPTSQQPESPPAGHQVEEEPCLVAEGSSLETGHPLEPHSESLASRTPSLPAVESNKAHVAQVECRINNVGKEPEQNLDHALPPCAPELTETVQIEEPMPGMLFFRQCPPQPLSKPQTPQHTETTANTNTTTTTPTCCKISVTVVATVSATSQGSVQCGGSPGISGIADQLPADEGTEQALHEHENNESGDCQTWPGEEGTGGLRSDEDEGDCAGQELVSSPLQRPISHDFLEMRFKIQKLLEPQPYLAVLPHHVLVQIFSLLPTQALAALKCTCRDFKAIIEHYDVRPTDSRWVSEPRYRDDPCKHCKKHYQRGDVSLCRWHHKSYCQAMPYGPGYWMCCRGANKDTPGCNVGLHDNRWVPSSHRMSIYKNRDVEE